VPELVRTNRQLIERIKVIVASTLEPGRVFNPDTDYDVALYFKRRNLFTGRMEGIALKAMVTDQMDQRDKAQILITAQQGHVEPAPEEGLLNIILTDGTLHNFDEATTATGYRYLIAEFAEMRWQVRMSDGPLAPEAMPDRPAAVTTPQLKQAIEHGNLSRDERGSLRAELQQRRSIPLACLAFALLGVPLAIRVRPTGKAVAFSIAFGLIFFYYVMLKWGVTLCQNGSAFGVFVIFLPNVLVGGMGIILFYRALRQ
jgi:lipopolysaccharide export system permease protein